MTDFASARVRYPLRAKLGVALASLFFLVELGALALFMMPMIPLVPVFVMVMLGNGLVLAEVVSWAVLQGKDHDLQLRRQANTTTGEAGALLLSGRSTRNSLERRAARSETLPV